MNCGGGLSEEAARGAFRELVRVLARSTDEDFISDFLECMFTSTELHDLATRWILVKELDKGTPQRQIARMFGISLCKITRGSRELKKEGSAFRKLLDSGSQSSSL